MTCRILYIGSERDKSYPKTASLVEDLMLSGLDVSVLYLGVDDGKADVPTRVIARLTDLCRIGKCLFNKGRRGLDILWLSEWKYSLVNLVPIKIMAWLIGAKLVSGPHVLLLDSRYFGSGGPRITALDEFRYWALDSIKVRLLNALQSYSLEYLYRVRQYTGSSGKAIVAPIGSGAGLTEKSLDHLWHRDGSNRSDLRMVFWGAPSMLHGLSIVPGVLAECKARGLVVTLTILAGACEEVTRVKALAIAAGVGDQVVTQNIKVSGNWNVLNSYDIAISHLVSEGLTNDQRDACDSVLTNKMYEALSLGVPLLIAGTKAVRSILRESDAVLVEPGDQADIVERLLAMSSRDDLEAIGRAGFIRYQSEFSAQRRRMLIKEALLRVCADLPSEQPRAGDGQGKAPIAIVDFGRKPGGGIAAFNEQLALNSGGNIRIYDYYSVDGVCDSLADKVTMVNIPSFKPIDVVAILAVTWCSKATLFFIHEYESLGYRTRIMVLLILAARYRCLFASYSVRNGIAWGLAKKSPVLIQGPNVGNVESIGIDESGRESKAGALVIGAIKNFNQVKLWRWLATYFGEYPDDPVTFVSPRGSVSAAPDSGWRGNIRIKTNLTNSELIELIQQSRIAILPYIDGASVRRSGMINCLCHGLVTLTTPPCDPDEIVSLSRLRGLEFSTADQPDIRRICASGRADTDKIRATALAMFDYKSTTRELIDYIDSSGLL